MKKFIKKVEDFTCENCGTRVTGTGYTNHCPQCLWSKHVDVNPGDRLSQCAGMMRPVSIEGDVSNGYKVVQVCDSCQHMRKNTVGDKDNMDTVLAIVRADVARKLNVQKA